MASISHSLQAQGTWTRFKWIAVGLLAVLTLVFFIVNVQQYCFLGDDAYISFRYALHLYQGHGLVWNPGERVEGYTNFLWVIIMALGMAVKIPEGVKRASESATII